MHADFTNKGQDISNLYYNIHSEAWDIEKGDNGVKKLGDGDDLARPPAGGNGYNKNSDSIPKNARTETKGGIFSALGSLLFRADTTKTVKANLGDKNSFYYDENQKRWVGKNEKNGTDAEIHEPPPPPQVTTFQSQIVDEMRLSRTATPPGGARTRYADLDDMNLTPSAYVAVMHDLLPKPSPIQGRPGTTHTIHDTIREAPQNRPAPAQEYHWQPSNNAQSGHYKCQGALIQAPLKSARAEDGQFFVGKLESSIKLPGTRKHYRSPSARFPPRSPTSYKHYLPPRERERSPTYSFYSHAPGIIHFERRAPSSDL